MTETDRAQLTKRALKKELTLEDVYYMTLSSIQPYVELLNMRIQTKVSDTEFIIKTTPGQNLEGETIEPWVYIGKVELDAIRVYTYLEAGQAPEVREWNV